MKKFLIVFALLVSNISLAQTITGVDAFQSGNEIIVEYAISASATSDSHFSVVPSFSTDGGRNFTVLKNISGDVENVSSGTGKKIIWRVLEEYDSFVYPNVIFKVDLVTTVSNSAEEYYKKGMQCEQNKKYADAIRYYRLASEQGHKQADERIKALQLYFW